jgi:hypothetical protein
MPAGGAAAAPPARAKSASYHRAAPASAAAAAQRPRHAARDFFSENRASTPAELAAVDGSSMTDFIATGGRFPVLVVTCDRAEMLQRTLASLLSVRGLRASDIFAVQDGSHAGVAAALAQAGVRSHQKAASPATDGAERIAQHYGYALSHAFDVAFPGAPALIIVEDDFVFAPDFYEYFHAVAPAVEADPSLWIASAWNDNGARGRCAQKARPLALRAVVIACPSDRCASLRFCPRSRPSRPPADRAPPIARRL